MSNPVVSVIVPTFNRSSLLLEAIGSVQRQTFGDWEIIVVDDGSDDDSLVALADLDEARLTVIEHAHCGLPGVLRNVAISHARGRYVAFLDSDDLWQPTKLEKQVAALDDHDAAWCYTYSSRLIDGVVRSYRPLPGQRSVAIDVMNHQGTITTPAVMVRSNVLRELGGFDETLDFCEDNDLWIRLGLHAEPLCVSEELTVTRHVPDHFPSPEQAVCEAWVHVYSKHLDNQQLAVAQLSARRAALKLRRIAKLRAPTKGIEALQIFRRSLQFEMLSPAVARDAAALALRILLRPWLSRPN